MCVCVGFLQVCDACACLPSLFFGFSCLYQPSDRVTNIKRLWGDQPSLAASYDQANSSTVNTGY